MEELRDKNGLTESEFLAKYDVTKFERPSVTVDIIIIKDGKVLLIKRGGHPCLGKLAFPGGFLEMTEDVYTAAARELMEETCLKVKSLRQLNVASTPNRDPRTRIITVPFLADIEDPTALKAADDAAEVAWYGISYKTIPFGDKTIFEIALNGNDNRYTFKVTKSKDKSGISADYSYKAMGENPLAGDHAEILAMALDNL
ncbi:MAG: NUDIX hydrolase [Clostridia bacterium]|nr:NUDIX hydrolase [Clostridia bacterium]MBR5279129.1 NUDIX hydrolase [Clostridia bacterium]